MADLVPDDVVEHPLGREQQPPVEAHAPVRRARRPAGALGADRQPVVGAAGVARWRGPDGPRSRRAPSAGRSARAPGGHRRPAPAGAPPSGARACARLRDQLQRTCPGRAGCRPGRRSDRAPPGLAQPALDPWAQLAHRRRRRALGGAGRAARPRRPCGHARSPAPAGRGRSGARCRGSRSRCGEYAPHRVHNPGGDDQIQGEAAARRCASPMRST